MSQIASRTAILMASPLSLPSATTSLASASAAVPLVDASLFVATPATAAGATVTPTAKAPTPRDDEVPAPASSVTGADPLPGAAAIPPAGVPAASTAPGGGASTYGPVPANAGATPAMAATAFAQPATATTTTAHAGTPTAFPAPPSAASGIGGAVTALVVVVALILALAWLAKRMPVLGGGVGSNPALRIVASLALGPRERLVVVAVGDTQLLLGVGAGGTRTLHTLEHPLTVATATTPAFAQLLAQHFGKRA